LANQTNFYFRFVNSLLPLRLRREGLANDILGVNGWGDYESRGDLKKISVPTIIIQSRNDTSGNYAQSLEIAAQIPGARVVSLDDTGHFCWLGRNTAEWESELAGFLSVATAARLTIEASRLENSVTITWNPLGGRLQSALSPGGPWANVPKESPATIPIVAGESRFYQVVNP
jgi:hypothetical protein